MKYHWPGNQRELDNIIARAVLMCREDILLPTHLFFDEDVESSHLNSNFSSKQFRGTIYEMEKELILNTLEDINGNKTRAAECLGISIRTLRNKLNDYQKKTNS